MYQSNSQIIKLIASQFKYLIHLFPFQSLGKLTVLGRRWKQLDIQNTVIMQCNNKRKIKVGGKAVVIRFSGNLRLTTTDKFGSSHLLDSLIVNKTPFRKLYCNMQSKNFNKYTLKIWLYIDIPTQPHTYTHTQIIALIIELFHLFGIRQV